MVINQTVLSGIYKSFSALFMEAVLAAESMWPVVAMETFSGGRSVDYKWLGALPQMREWVGDRVIKSLAAFSYELVNKKYEAAIEVDRDDIEDDQLGIYNPAIRNLAEQAARHPDILIWALLKAGFATECYDGQYFFDTDHQVAGASVSNSGGGSGAGWYLLDAGRSIKPLILQRRRPLAFTAMDDLKDEDVFMRDKFKYGVDDRKCVGYGLWQLAYGSKDTLNTVNFAAALAAMQAFKDDEGTPLGIRPTHLVVPPSLNEAGKKIVEATIVVESATPVSNVWAGSVKLLNVPWLA